MARIRSIKPGFCTSEDIAQLTIPCRLHFAMLWTYADDEGRGIDNPRLLKGALWPLDDHIDHAAIDAFHDELEHTHRIVRYELDGRRYFQINDFKKHQHPTRPVKSELPAPPECVNSEPTVLTQCSSIAAASPEGSSRGVVEERTLAPVPHPGRKNDPLWDAVMDACGVKSEDLTKSARGGYNKAVSELRNVGADPADIPTRARNYRRAYPNAALTPTALAKHWAALANTTSTTDPPGAAMPKPLTDEELAALEGRTA